MSKHHVTAVFEQFPWLDTHFGKFKPLLDNAIVSRADRTHLLTPTSVDLCQIFMFDENGLLISRVYTKRKWHWYKWTYSDYVYPTEVCVGPNLDLSYTIADVLAAMGQKAVECEYVVKVRTIPPPFVRYIEVVRAKKNRTFFDLLHEIVKNRKEYQKAEYERARMEIQKDAA